MSKRKTELERKEDTLSVVSVGDHDKVIAFQKKLGITVGQLIDILTMGEIATSEDGNYDPATVTSMRVVLDAENKSWVFLDHLTSYGVARPTVEINESYTIENQDMEKVCFKKLEEEVKALLAAADSLEDAGLRGQAEALRAQAEAKKSLIVEQTK